MRDLTHCGFARLDRRHARFVACVSIVAFSLACASPRKVNENMLTFMEAGDHHGALAVLEEAKDSAYKEKNAFLYYLERGMELHYAGEFEESNVSFQEATRLAE